MRYLFYLSMTIFWVFFLLVPLFKLISPERTTWTMLALLFTTFLISSIIAQLLVIKDALEELLKRKP